MNEAIAYFFARMLPKRLDVNNFNDSHFYIGRSIEDSDAWLARSSEWKYGYELQQRTLEYTFNIDPSLYLSGKSVLDFGCFTGGAGAAWMELYGIGELSGFDVEEIYVRGARNFASKKNLNAHYKAGFGEAVPFQGPFDTVVALDVFEHVRDVAQCLAECRRVLKPGGHLLVTFPPFWNPRAHHLKVTKTPALHWLFSGETLRRAQNRRYRELGFPQYACESLNGYRLPYLNGITVRQFHKLIGDWKVVVDRRRGIPAMGRVAKGSRVLRGVSALTSILARSDLFAEIMLDHVSMVLRRP